VNQAPTSGRAKAWVAEHRAALAAALSVTLVTVLCLWFACSYQDDFHVYMAGARDFF